MHTLRELRETKRAKLEELRKIVDAPGAATKGLSAKAQSRTSELTADIKRLNASIEIAEDLVDAERNAPALTTANGRSPAWSSIKGNGAKFKSFGEQMCAVASATLNKDIDKRLTYQAGPTGAGEGVGADGGFLVQQDFSSDLWKRTYETGQLTRRVRRIPLSATSNGLKINAIKESSRADGSRWGGVAVNWAGEAGALTGSGPKFRQIELDLKKLTGLAYVTDEMLSDGAALESVLRDAFTEEFGFKLDTGIMRGTGVGMPLGYLDHPATVAVAETIDPNTNALQGADTIIAENITQMWVRLWARSRPNAVWLINQEIEPQLMMLKVGDKPIYIPERGLADAPFATLLGRPIVPVEQASALGDKGDIQLVDLSQYLMIEKGGIDAASSIHVRFLQDEMVFRFILRADGMPGWDTALTPFQGGDTVSWAVVLGERDGTA